MSDDDKPLPDSWFARFYERHGIKPPDEIAPPVPANSPKPITPEQFADFKLWAYPPDEYGDGDLVAQDTAALLAYYRAQTPAVTMIEEASLTNEERRLHAIATVHLSYWEPPAGRAEKQ